MTQRHLGPFTLGSWEAKTAKPLLVAAFGFLIILTVPVINLHLDPNVKVAIRVFDVSIWFAFAVDYVVRLTLSPSRWTFVRTHIPDALMVALPALRPLRILRLLSLGNLLARRSANTLLRNTGIAVSGTAVLLVYIGAVGVLDAERDTAGANIRSFGDALWWACTTITTVGYGDRYPVTLAGRLIAVGLMVVGVALLGLLTAGIAAWFVRQTTDAALAAATDTMRQEVESLGDAERAAQQHVDAELEDVLVAMKSLDARLRQLQGRVRSPNGGSA